MTEERPEALFLGGDFLPSLISGFAAASRSHPDFLKDYLIPQLKILRRQLHDAYPKIFLIFGNDDGRQEESTVLETDTQGLWKYAHNRKLPFGSFQVYGYSYVPPTPFQLKDWERYDVSRYVDPGCISPEEGMRTIPVSDHEKKYATIKDDLEQLTAEDSLERSIFLFHAPPHNTKLDLAALEGKVIDHVPLDPHVGSIAIRRFIESRQPLLTLHGHIHESTSLTHSWQDRIGRTHAFTAAHDGQELAVIRFDPENLEAATRELI